MMRLALEDSQVVMVDFQEKLMPAIADHATILEQAHLLAKVANTLGVPLWGTEQNPSKLGPNPSSWRSLCKETLPKMHFSACDEGLLECLNPQPQAPQGNARSLPKHLQKNTQGKFRDQIVLAGCETHICLLQTAIDLMQEELEVWVVVDATGSRKSKDKDAALDRLAGAGAELVSLEMLIFEWLGTAEHEHFKTIHSWIK
jgi:nicotinamidase-related amidase